MTHTVLVSFIVILSTLLIDTIVHSKCMAPPPSSNFTLKGYYGLWYESGKIQTPGGAFFEKECVCTTIDVEPNKSGSEGDCTAINSCRKHTPKGEFLNATGQLTDMTMPGKWKEGFFAFAPKVDYTVIYLNEDFAVEYDCSESFGITNYCIHIMSRMASPDPTIVQQLVTFSENLGLNTDKLTFKRTQQATCW